MFVFNAACGCFLGNGRDNNEDNFYFNKKRLKPSNKGMKNPLKYKDTTEEPVLFAVFDGMGGASRGEEASYCASEIFGKKLKDLEEFVISGKEFMYEACDAANEVVNEIAKENRLGTMGTTVAALYFYQDEVIACNVGDSKIFRIRDQKMIQISQDHTDEKLLQSMGIEKKPVLLQYVGMPQAEMMLDPYVSKGDLESEDIYVICSDGITDVLSASDLYEIVCSNCPDEAVRQITAHVDRRNGQDNATVIVVRMV